MRVAVLGAGLQGAGVALELAAHGVDVDLYDRNASPMLEASLCNEAKIHLGLFYANDPSLKTARTVMRGALSFAPLLRRWLGDDADRIPVSPLYYYAVHRDSLLTPADMEAHFQACAAIAAESNAAENDYFGAPFRSPARRIEDVSRFFNPDLVSAAYETPEVAVSAEVMAAYVRSHLASEANIRCVMNATVLSVSQKPACTEVRFETSGETYCEGYDSVVNALWGGRLAVDETAGITPSRPWLFRVKYDLRVPSVPAIEGLPPVSMALGPFGDLVRYGNGEMYLSWYPAGMRQVSSALTPPRWPNRLIDAEAARVVDGTLTALTEIVPALAEVAPLCRKAAEVRGGVIFAWGETDISDPASDLHTRFNIGPHSYGSYHSIDTGKLTTAPMFAKQVADRIRGVDD